MRQRLAVRTVLASVVAVAMIVAATPAAATPTWVVTPPAAVSGVQHLLAGVSCASTNACFAVGTTVASGPADEGLIERWTGASWTDASVPSLPDTQMTGVSCGSPTSCSAVGYRNRAGINTSVIARWNGGTWSVVPSPSPASGLTNVAGVSCVSANSCVAVGAYNDLTGGRLLALHWNGAVWKMAATPVGMHDPDFRAVSCSSPTSCMAVGDNLDAGNVVHTVALSWNGTAWRNVATLDRAGSNSSQLWGVSCATATSCIGVGTAFVGGIARTLVERWNGGRWAITPSKDPGGNPVLVRLSAVSCRNADDCFAVGQSNAVTGIRTLTEHWNGQAWTIVTSVDPTGTSRAFHGVSCISPAACFAVGDYQPSGTNQQPLIERFESHAAYWMLDRDGNVYGFADGAVTSPRGSGTSVAIAAVETARGPAYWSVDSTGGHVRGNELATVFPSAPPLQAGESVTSIAGTPSAHGYWLFTSLGRVLRYGDAGSYGDMHSTLLNGPIVAAAATPTGHGYYLVGSDGGVFAFGDARFRGSMGATRLNRPVVGITPTADNRGYWLVAADGGVFAFDAGFRGSLGGVRLNRPIVGMVSYGRGYLMVGSDGGVFDFSDRPFAGSLGSRPPAAPVVGIAAVVD